MVNIDDLQPGDLVVDPKFKHKAYLLFFKYFESDLGCGLFFDTLNYDSIKDHGKNKIFGVTNFHKPWLDRISLVKNKKLFLELFQK